MSSLRQTICRELPGADRARSCEDSPPKSFSRRSLLAGAVFALPALSLQGCTPWVVIRQAPHNPLANNRDFSLGHIGFGYQTDSVSERETGAMVFAIQERLTAGGRWYESQPPFVISPPDRAPPSAFVLHMAITIHRLRMGSGDASMQLTIVEPNRNSFSGEGAIVDQIDVNSRVSVQGSGLGFLIMAAATPHSSLMRNLGYGLANKTLAYLRRRTTEIPAPAGPAQAPVAPTAPAETPRGPATLPAVRITPAGA